MSAQILLILLLSLLNLTLLGLVLGWGLWLLKKGERISRQDLSIHSHESKIIEAARKRSQTVIAKALQRAGDYLKAEKNIGEDEVNRLKVSLEVILKENLKQLEEVEPVIAASLEVLIKQANDQFEKAISQFKTGLEQNIDIAKGIADREIEEYKKARVQSLETDLNNKITQIAKEIIPKAISLEDHYDLVMESLEKMKGEMKI